MKKRVFIVIYVLFFSYSLFAQENKSNFYISWESCSGVREKASLIAGYTTALQEMAVLFSQGNTASTEDAKKATALVALRILIPINKYGNLAIINIIDRYFTVPENRSKSFMDIAFELF